jgi:hypothetical protein
MGKLESMIAQLVGDLLQTIGDATVEDLRELFAGRPENETFAGLPIELGPLASPTLPGRPTLPRRGARRSERPGARRSALLSTPLSGPFAPPGVAEITDPESLLSLGRPGGASARTLAGASLSNGALADSAAAPARSASRGRAHALLEVREPATRAGAQAGRPTEADVESPASGVRPVGGPIVKLSDNETLARVSNSGVVIRRKKRA